MAFADLLRGLATTVGTIITLAARIRDRLRSYSQRSTVPV
jgi:hypothetical protein